MREEYDVIFLAEKKWQHGKAFCYFSNRFGGGALMIQTVLYAHIADP